MTAGSLARGRRARQWVYAGAWLLRLTIYLAAFVVNGVPLGYAVRNALARTTTLPTATPSPRAPPVPYTVSTVARRKAERRGGRGERR